MGGTAGIGETTVREFMRYTLRPTVYLVGRNEEQASRIIGELRNINGDAKIDFIKSDISLLRNVDKACKNIQDKEEKINLLFMTAGFARLNGRDGTIPCSCLTAKNLHYLGTPEGLDKLLNLHYYSRWRFAYKLLPQLTKAGDNGGLSRVVSVLAAGRESNIYVDDLALQKNYSMRTCMKHSATMNSLAAEELAKTNPKTSFIHSSPGIVKTQLAAGFGPVLHIALNVFMTVIKPWTISLQESGERHVFQATSNIYPPCAIAEETAVVGSNAVKGSSGYLLGSDGSPNGAVAMLEKHRSQGVGEKIWQHTLNVFEKVCGKEDGRY